jgi:hypothetical protein
MHQELFNCQIVNVRLTCIVLNSCVCLQAGEEIVIEMGTAGTVLAHGLVQGAEIGRVQEGMTVNISNDPFKRLQLSLYM